MNYLDILYAHQLIPSILTLCSLYQQRNSWGKNIILEWACMHFIVKKIENILRKIISWKRIFFFSVLAFIVLQRILNVRQKKKEKVLRLPDKTEIKSNQWITALDNVWTLYIPSNFSINFLFVFSKLIFFPKGCMLFNAMSLI